MRWWGDLSTRNHLRVSPERRTLPPHRSPAAPEHRKVQGHGLRCGTGRTHSGLGTTEPEPPRPPPPPAAVAAAPAKPSFGTTPPTHNMSAAAAARGRAGAWKRLGKVRHKGNDTGGRRGRLARTQIVEAETAATVVPQEARGGLREASPDTLCATGSLSSRPPPFPIEFREWRRPSPTRACPPICAAQAPRARARWRCRAGQRGAGFR